MGSKGVESAGGDTCGGRAEFPGLGAAWTPGGESSGAGPVRGRRSQRSQRGWAWHTRAHLALAAVSLLPQLLLQLFVESAHFPLVLTLSPSRNRDITGMSICQFLSVPS